MLTFKPLISIIIPTFNRAHLIGETLDSILAQTHTHWECIVVDDGSSDNTEEVVTKYKEKDSRFKYFRRPNTYLSGGNGARNYGLDVSQGVYVNWFDDDDWMHPEKLEIQVNALQMDNYDFSICQTSVFEENPEIPIGLRHDKIFSENPIKDFITREIIFLVPSPLIRKDFLLRHQLKFDEKLLAAQDWDFNFRCLLKTKRVHVEQKSLVSIRRHPHNISSSSEFEEIRMWHYFLARVKIYKICLKEDLLKDEYLNLYFKEYFIRFFKKYIKGEKLEYVHKVYNMVLKEFYGFSVNLKIQIYLFFIKIFGFRYRLRNSLLSLVK